MTSSESLHESKGFGDVESDFVSGKNKRQKLPFTGCPRAHMLTNQTMRAFGRDALTSIRGTGSPMTAALTQHFGLWPLLPLTGLVKHARRTVVLTWRDPLFGQK
jgi:hypothetical protein